MSFEIIKGNALALPLEDASVDLVVTSPPYFGLRSYQDGGEHYDGQLGSEATPAEFLDALLAATREMVRVLKPSGSIFVNLGDKYCSGTSTARSNIEHPANYGNGKNFAPTDRRLSAKEAGVPTKSLLGIPWRYALRCIDDLGLILRAEIIWSKPNGLPESVTDRVRRSHEQWFHLVRRPRYYAAVDEIREEHVRDFTGSWGKNGGHKYAQASMQHERQNNLAASEPHPLGKLPGSVWTVPTQPLTVPPELGVDHFAAYPMELPRRLILGWSPPGVCTACGEGRRPVALVERIKRNEGPGGLSIRNGDERGVSPTSMLRTNAIPRTTITGYACACPDATAPTTPAVVLDPFGGTGTTALVAHAHGRHGISVDLSADYCRLAEWRCNDRGQLAAALKVEKPEPVPEGQLDIFGGDAA